MDLSFKQPHKSVKQLPIELLPDFTVLTGINGSGKTHFLEAINSGHIAIDGIPTNQIKTFRFDNVLPVGSRSGKPVPIETAGNQLYSQLMGHMNRHLFEIKTAMKRRGNEEYEENSIQDLASIAYGQPKGHRKTGSRQEIKAILESRSEDLLLDISKNPRLENAIDKLLKRTSIPIFAVTQADLQSVAPLLHQPVDPFCGEIQQLMQAYCEGSRKNVFSRFRAQTTTGVTSLTDDEFKKRFGIPPWDLLNIVLEKMGLPFAYDPPPADPALPFIPRLRHLGDSSLVTFDTLSSGEKVIMSMAIATFYYNSRESPSPTSLLLLDEVDAVLHPAMIGRLLTIIRDLFGKRFGIRTILATHSCSTVALSPDDSIHVMTPLPSKIQPADKSSACRALTEGVPTLSIKLENRRFVFVESDNDVRYYEALEELLAEELDKSISICFMPAGPKGHQGVSRVVNIIKAMEANELNSIFGLVDWDKKKEPTSQILVPGLGKRYAIENFIFDPLLLAAFLLRDTIKSKSHFALGIEETYVDFRCFSSERLQKISDLLVAEILGIDLDSAKKDTIECSYLNKKKILISKDYLWMPGHDLEKRIVELFPELQKYNQNLKLSLLKTVANDLRGLIPEEVLQAMQTIQKPT